MAELVALWQAGDSWIARAQHEGRDIRIFMDGDVGAANPLQLQIANRLASSLPELSEIAERYLDYFVGRAKVCGNAAERWWLEEVELRDLTRARASLCQFFFTIHRDGGGGWTVEFSVHDDKLRPIRFERKQG